MVNKLVENGLKVSAYILSAVLVGFAYSPFSYHLAITTAGSAFFGLMAFLIGYFLNRSPKRSRLSVLQNIVLMSIYHALATLIYAVAEVKSKADSAYLTYAFVIEIAVAFVIYRIGTKFFGNSVCETMEQKEPTL